MANWVGREHADFIVKGDKVFVRCQGKRSDPAPMWCDGIGATTIPEEGQTTERVCEDCHLPFAVKYTKARGVQVFTPVQ
jgi:hypothetical protein